MLYAPQFDNRLKFKILFDRPLKSTTKLFGKFTMIVWRNYIQKSNFGETKCNI